MTLKESNMKLVKDITRIRIATNKDCRKNTINDIVKNIMETMDAGNEASLISELEEHRGPAMAAKLMPFATPSVVDLAITKLKSRIKAREEEHRLFKNFTAEEYKIAEEYGHVEIHEAATILSRAFYTGQKDALINAQVAEIFMYDYDAMMAKLCEEAIKIIKDTYTTRQLKKMPKLPESATTTLITFNESEKNAIQNIETMRYYDNWIYERFEPIGVVHIEFGVVVLTSSETTPHTPVTKPISVPTAGIENPES